MDKSSAHLKVRGFLVASIMNNIIFKSAAEARKNWSQLLDDIARKKPQFVRCAQDDVIISDVRLLKDLLEIYTFTATEFVEEDNSITLSLNELDIVENGSTEEEAKNNLAIQIVKYSKEFYEDFDYWSTAPNRKKHIPYVLKVLLTENIDEIGEKIIYHY